MPASGPLIDPAPPLTCGVVVRSPSGWLLAHATSRAWWDLPKGKQDPGETPLDTALRECQEETGLDLSRYRSQFQDLGAATYNRRRGKALYLFLLDLDAPLSLSSCACRTQVLRRGVQMPEMDDFAWVAASQVPGYVKPRMRRHLVARQLLPPCAAMGA